MGQRRKQARLILRPIVSAASGKTSEFYYIRDGKRFFSTGFGPDRLVEAEQSLAAYIASRPEPGQKGQRLNPYALPIGTLICAYAEGPALAAPEPASVKARLERLLEFLGDETVGDIEPARCDDYVKWRTRQPVRSFKNPALARRVDPQTARRELEELQIAISWYDRDVQALTQLPRFRFPEKNHVARDALERGQAARFLQAARGRRYIGDGRWRPLSKSAASNRAHIRRQFIMGLYTGSRPSVLTELRWKVSDHHAYLDLEGGMLHRRGRRAPEPRNKRRPPAPIPTRLLGHLRRWKRIDDRTNVVRQLNGLDPIETVVHHGGEALSGPIRTSYENIARDAQLTVSPTPHWLRHTCASWLIRSGMDIALVSEFLGVSIRILVKHYGHLRPDYVDELNAAINQGSRQRREGVRSNRA